MTPEKTPSKAPEQTHEYSPHQSAPAAGADLRLTQQVADAVQQIDAGAALDAYFGLSSRAPTQPEAEAQRNDQLLRALAAGTGDPNTLLTDLAAHTNSSEADPDALRALMYGSRKPPVK